MPKTPEEIKAIVGAEIWPDIQEMCNAIRRENATERQQVIFANNEAVSALTAELETLKAEDEIVAKRTQQAIAAAASLLNEPDAEKLRDGMKKIIAFASAPEVDRRLAELDAQASALAAQREELEAMKG